MDKIIERALSHWYAPDHNLYGDPLPALMGIVGESGELCDIWKKKLYKPGYVFDRDAFLDELGDCLFYTSVLCHYRNCSVIEVDECTTYVGDTLRAIVTLNDAASNMLTMQVENDKTLSLHVHRMVASISAILHFEFSGMALEELSRLNYDKLNERAANGEGYNRGEEITELICNYHKKCSYNDDQCKHKSKHLEIDDIVCGKDICYHVGEIVQCIPYTDDECSNELNE